MNCLQNCELADALTLAVRACGGVLADVHGGWQWRSANGGERAVLIRPGQNRHRLVLDPLGVSAALGSDMAHLSAPLEQWLRRNRSLPPGIGITVQSDARPLFLAAIPAVVSDTAQLAQSFEVLLKGFADLPTTLDDEPPGAPPSEADNRKAVLPDAILTWADDAGLSIESTENEDDANDDDSASFRQFTVKLPGSEPASLVIGDDRVTLAISGAPEVDNESVAPVADAACALLALGVGNRLPLIRASMLSGTAGSKALEYQATIARRGEGLPPAAWLRQASAELSSALRATRRELEALHASPALASIYLSARGFDPESPAPS